MLKGGYIRGSMNTALGEVTFQGRRGQQIMKSKPEPMHLKDVKNMSDDELKKWAKKHGMTFEEAKKIRAKQKAIEPAIEACKEEKEEDPAEFNRKYKPRKEGETSFNVCVGLKLKGKGGEKGGE